MSSIKMQKNTDTVDIENNCLGVSCWIEYDSTNQLNSNRGLHIQIRHNNDKKIFNAASEVQSLISAAPDMLKALELILTDNKLMNAMNKKQARAILDSVKKAKGL